MDRHDENELPPRRELEDARAAGLIEIFDPYPRFRDQLASIVDIERIRAAREARAGRAALRLRRRLVHPPARGRAADPARAAHRAQPVSSAASTPSRSARTSTSGSARSRAGARTSASPSTATPTGSGWRPRRASSSTSCRSTACCTGTCSTCAGRSVRRSTPSRPPRWRSGWPRSTARRPTRPGSASSTSGPKMTETHAVIGGEESGGFGFGMHIPERDGLASGLFLLDLWLTKGKQASEVLAELQALAGPSYYNRIDIRFEREGYDAVKTDTLARLAWRRRTTLAGSAGRRAARSSTRTTASSSTATTARGCSSASAAPRRCCASTSRRARPEDVDALLAEGRRIAAARRRGCAQ